MSRRFNRRPVTEAERAARRQADRDRLERAARALLTSDGWQRWIQVRASNGLSRYSLRNQWLIAIDCHARGITPTYVAGFRDGSPRVRSAGGSEGLALQPSQAGFGRPDRRVFAAQEAVVAHLPPGELELAEVHRRRSRFVPAGMVRDVHVGQKRRVLGDLLLHVQTDVRRVEDVQQEAHV